MAYQALYRQWRPAAFSEMVGQELVVTALRNQVRTGRIGHAYLFTGSRGTGKTSMAKILARAVNCEHPEDGDACGLCDSCVRLQGEGSFDVLEYDAASNSRVDDMRDILETTQYPPQFGKYKIYIIDEVHMLSNSAFNALLKTLEEPPEYMIFVLATTEPQKVPATILSRCQRYDFTRIPAGQIAGRLREAADGAGAEATDGALNMIARAAEGGMRDALSILDMCIGYGVAVDEALVRKVLGTSDRDFLFRFAEALLEEDAAAVLTLVDQLMREGREPAVFAGEMARHLRALLMARHCGDDFPRLMELTPEDAEAYAGQAQNASDTRLMSMIDLFMAVEPNLRVTSSPRVALETAALHACLRTGEVDAAALRDRVEELEKKLASLQECIAPGAAAVRTDVPADARKPEGKAGAEPEKKAAAAAPAPSGDLQKIWKDAMSAAAKSHPGLFGMLNNGRLAEAEDDTFVWEAKKKDSFEESYLAIPANHDLMESILTQAAGRNCRFIIRTGTAKPAPKDGDGSGLQMFRETFGPENVIVQEGN